MLKMRFITHKYLNLHHIVLIKMVSLVSVNGIEALAERFRLETKFLPYWCSGIFSPVENSIVRSKAIFRKFVISGNKESTRVT